MRCKACNKLLTDKELRIDTELCKKDLIWALIPDTAEKFLNDLKLDEDE